MSLDHNEAPEQPGQASDGPGTPEFDYARSYNELRPEYTRTTQQLSQAQQQLSEYEQLFAALQDPASQAEALAALGYELDAAPQQGTSSADDEFVDPLEVELKQLREQLDDVRQWKESEANTRQEQDLIAMRDDYIGEAISFIEGQTGSKFSAKEEEVLGNLAIAMEGQDGLPNVQAAYEAIYGNEGVLEHRRQTWIDSKRSAAAAPFGQAASTTPLTPGDKRSRVQYIDERMRALEDQR